MKLSQLLSVSTFYHFHRERHFYERKMSMYKTSSVCTNKLLVVHFNFTRAFHSYFVVVYVFR